MSDELENRVDKVEDRMDRVELLLERLALAQAEDRVARAEERDDWKARMKASDRRMEDLSLKIAEVNEGISVLFHTVDEWIRNNPRSNGGPGSVQKS